MDTSIEFGCLQNALEDSLSQCLENMTPEDLKALDWFTWETDFFLEQKNIKAA